MTMHIMERDGVRGKEFVFRVCGQLYVFKTREEAEIKYLELTGGSLF